MIVTAFWAATSEKRQQLLTTMRDAEYMGTIHGLVLGLKPQTAFLLLFNLVECVTTGDSRLITKGIMMTGSPLLIRA